MPLWLVLILAVALYGAIASLIVVDHLADDMVYYWSHGEDYTPAMRTDALGAIVVPACFWFVTFPWRGFVWSVDRAAFLLANRLYAKGGSEYVGRH